MMVTAADEGVVCRGHSEVDLSEVFSLYGGLHVPMHVTDNLLTSSKWKLTQFLDMFSLPEATLYADLSQVSPTQLLWLPIVPCGM